MYLIHLVPVALVLPAAALVLCMCVPAVKNKTAEGVLKLLCWPALAAIALGAAALLTGTTALAAWLTCGGLAAFLLLAGLLSESDDPYREGLRLEPEPPDEQNPSPSGVSVDWERFEADLAAWAATPRTGSDLPIGPDSPPSR